MELEQKNVLISQLQSQQNNSLLEKEAQEQKERERRERMKSTMERIKLLEKEVETKNNLVWDSYIVIYIL